MGEKNLSRRERERLRQSREILAAALALFSERGYHSVSMHEIAEKAEFWPEQQEDADRLVEAHQSRVIVQPSGVAIARSGRARQVGHWVVRRAPEHGFIEGRILAATRVSPSRDEARVAPV